MLTLVLATVLDLLHAGRNAKGMYIKPVKGGVQEWHAV